MIDIKISPLFKGLTNHLFFSSSISLATTTTTTTTDVPTTLPAAEMLYPQTSDYHWDQFDKNASLSETIGGWSEEKGFGQGPFGFGSAIKFGTEQVYVV